MKYSMLSAMLKRAGLVAAVMMFAGACATTRAPTRIAGSPTAQVSAWDADGDDQYVVRSMFFKDRGLHPS